MKKYNNIDEFFKEKVTDYKVPPSEKVWQNIESEYFNKGIKGKRFVFTLIFVSLILIIGSSITLIMLTNRTEHNNTTLIPDNQIVSSNNLNKADYKDKSASLIISEPDPAVDGNTNKLSSSIQLSQNKSDNTLNGEQDIQNSNPNDNTHVIIVADKKNADLVFSDINKEGSIVTNYPTLYSDKILTNNFQINKLNRKSTSLIENSFSNSLLNNFDIKTIDEYIERRRNIHIYTGASTSIAMVYYSVTRDQSAWSADLFYGIKLKKFYIETGIGFQKMKEQGNFKIDYKTNDSIGYYNKVVSFELNPGNPNELFYNIKTTTVYDSIKHYMLQSPLYYYNYISVPIRIGYCFYKHPKFSVSAETGIIYSLLTSTISPNVSYNDPESQLIGITNNTPIRVEHNFRIHAALRLNYNISKTISLHAQPEFTNFLNSIYEKQPNINITKPYTMGMRFGICFDF